VIVRGCLIVLALVAASSSALAQRRRTCDIEFPNTPESREQSFATPTGNRNVFIGGGVHAICRRDRLDIRADSAEYYGDEKRLFLVGNVVYDEPRIHLTSDYLTYFGLDERVVASSNVNVRLPSGSTMSGPQAEYLRRYPARPVSVLTAIGRPTVNLVEQGAPGAPPEPPTTVLASTFVVLQDSLIHGTGQVEITRPDLVAKGDSAFIDSGEETMRLMRQPSVDGTRGRPYRLTGSTIDIFSTQRRLQRVVSRDSATATSEDMDLAADTIDLRVTNDLLQEAYAWGAGRARAKSATQDIRADSIHLVMPNQRVRVANALGAARAETMPDTLRIRTTERDWLMGDTLVATFDTTPPPPRPAGAPRDSADRPRIERLRAAGDARAYYHLPPSDTTTREPAINYVRGRVIIVDFDSARVATVTVEGRSSGVYLEPVRRDTASAVRDTTNARPDTASAVRDTAVVPRSPAPADGQPAPAPDTPRTPATTPLPPRPSRP